jgi:hypothetical protein
LTGLDVDERSRKERLDADVDREASLDPLDDAAPDGRSGAVRLLDFVPDLHLLGLVLGEDHVAVLVLGAFQQDIHAVSRLHEHVAGEVGELGHRDDSFGFVADVDDHLRRVTVRTRPDDLPFHRFLKEFSYCASRCRTPGATFPDLLAWIRFPDLLCRSQPSWEESPLISI